MKKIPTLFQREFDHHCVVNINPVAPPELQWVLDGEGIATEKVDGASCRNTLLKITFRTKVRKTGVLEMRPDHHGHVGSEYRPGASRLCCGSL